MKKLKLQMHLSLDNYVNMEQGGPNFKWNNEVIKFCVNNLENVDTILLGRNTAQEFIPCWDEVATNSSYSDFALGKRISEIPKVVFSNTMTHHHWKNTSIINGNIKGEVIKLKESKGKDILVYGGASFASCLIQDALVDEFYFLLNPFCLGKGLTIFKTNKNILAFTLVKSMPFPCGTVILCYKPNY
jgi:dihydrofolate reductase